MVSTPAKQIWLVIFCQAACVAVGLWMEHQFAMSSIQQATMDVARSDIDALAERGRNNIGTLSLDALAADTELQTQVQRSLAGDAPIGGGAIVVDRDWQLVVATDPAVATEEPHLAIGTRLDWTPFEDAPELKTGVLQGTLRFEDGEHIAAARALDGGTGYVVVHRPVKDVLHASTAVVQSLPWLSAITLVWTCAMLAVVVYLILTRFHDDVRRQRQLAASQTLQRTQNLVRTRDAVIFGLAKLADSRDPETGDHLERISIYSTTLAATLQRHPKYAKVVSPSFVRLIGISSALHDIGKVGIEDSILRKPAPLTLDERNSMQTHTTIGGECLSEIEQRLGSSNFLHMAREIALAHHERWDGTGYPEGLSGEAIPLAARIVAIADVYDALSSKRVYKPGFPHEECVEIIRSEAGKQFDPDLLDVWMSIEGKFRDIAIQYASASPEERLNVVLPEPGATRQLRREEVATSTFSIE